MNDINVKWKINDIVPQFKNTLYYYCVTLLYYKCSVFNRNIFYSLQQCCDGYCYLEGRRFLDGASPPFVVLNMEAVALKAQDANDHISLLTNR